MSPKSETEQLRARVAELEAARGVQYDHQREIGRQLAATENERDEVRDTLRVVEARAELAAALFDAAFAGALPDEDAETRHVQPFDPWEDGEDAPASHQEPECPGEDCPTCSGEVCRLCGAGSWSSVTTCEHDALERHQEPKDAKDSPNDPWPVIYEERRRIAMELRHRAKFFDDLPHRTEVEEVSLKAASHHFTEYAKELESSIPPEPPK